MSDTETRYLRFSLQETKPRTSIWAVHSRVSNGYLGSIAWFGRWRQYAFSPAPDCVFNPECLADIANFTRTLTMENRTSHGSKV